MEMFMYRLVRKGVWLGALTIVAVAAVGCNSTTTTTEAATVSECSSSSCQETTAEATPPSSHAGETNADRQAPPQTSTSDAPYASRMDPFSEDRIKALEASLRPLEAVPAQTQATVPRGG